MSTSQDTPEPDLILLCNGGRTFKVHSASVCQQSTYFQQMVADKSTARGEWTDVDTVARVLHYLHYGTYSFMTLYPATMSDSADGGAQSPSALSIGADPQKLEERAIRSGGESLADILIAHVRVHVAADYLASQLSGGSEEVFSARLGLYSERIFDRASGFSDLLPAICEVYKSAVDHDVEKFKAHLLAMCLHSAEDVQDDADLLSLITANDESVEWAGFRADFLIDALKELSKANERIRVLEGQLGSRARVPGWIDGIERGTPEAGGS